jgi:hypothetical protein
MIFERPTDGDCDDFFMRYVHVVPVGDLVEIYVRQERQLVGMIDSMSDREADFRYAHGKWSIKEVLGHACDAERMFGYWMFCVSRGEPDEIGSIHIGEYVAAGRFSERPITSLLEEWTSVRGSSLSLLRSLRHDHIHKRALFRGTATTILAMACIIPGHVQHHMAILRERYRLGQTGVYDNTTGSDGLT